MSPPCRQSEALWRTSREYNARYYRVVIMAATANKRVRRPIFRHWSLYNRFLPCFFPPPVFLLFISYPCSRFLRFVSRFIPRFLPFLIFCHSFSGIIHFSRSYPRRFISKLRCNRSNSKESVMKLGELHIDDLRIYVNFPLLFPFFLFLFTLFSKNPRSINR